MPKTINFVVLFWNKKKQYTVELEKNKLKVKEDMLTNAVKTLKNEFVGIDEIIDGVVSCVKSWYMFPETHKTPLIINLFGLTGTGKTSLIRRLCTLLDLEEDFFYFNFAEIGECTSWEIEEKINDELSDDRSNRVFVYDEFQFASTLDANGDEKDKKSGMKPFWELLDTGRLPKRNNWWDMHYLINAVYYIRRICSRQIMEVRDGVWINANECLAQFTTFEINKMRSVLVWNEGPMDDTPSTDEASVKNGQFFLSRDVWNAVVKVLAKDSVEKSDEIYESVRKMNVFDVAEFLTDVYTKSCKGYDMDFHNSIIFVIANVDEAYEMALDVDPDMSADTFHAMSKKITVVDIKKALQKRFRNEQIARLGNIQFIYPSFSEKSFKEIIRRQLADFCRENEELTGYKTTFSDSLVKLIFKEAVFPTHGTRPIFSSIYDIVKSKTADVVLYIYEHDIDACSLVYGASGLSTTVKIRGKDGTTIKTLRIKNQIRVENLRKVRENGNQPIVAVHESGHFIVYNVLCGKLPDKLVSVTVGGNAGGFMMREHSDDEILSMSFVSVKNDISVSLGGYVAEGMVFGDTKRTCGSMKDIESATATASALVRKCGVFEPNRTTFVENMCVENNMFVPGEGKTNNRIRAIISESMGVTEDILTRCREQLKQSAQYLLEHPSMPKKVMEEIASSIPEDVISEYRFDAERYYTEKLIKFK